MRTRTNGRPGTGATAPPVRLETLDVVTSTMDVARERVLSGQVRFGSSGASIPTGIVAATQTRGRGRRGAAWFDSPGAGLCATYFVRIDGMPPAMAGRLSLVAGVAAAGALAALVEGCPRIRVGLKWPNDILLNGKKAGGVLIETLNAPDGAPVALVGVGINLSERQLPNDLQRRATSVLLEGGPACDRQSVAEQVAISLNQWARAYERSGLPAVLAAWRRYDETQGRRFDVMCDGSAHRAIAEGVNDDGSLRIRAADGTILSAQFASYVHEVGEPQPET